MDEAEWVSSICRGHAERIEELERENAALREAGHLAEKIIVQRTDEIRHLESENAALKNAIALGQENCDAEYERLREERDEAIAENVALRADSKQLADHLEELLRMHCLTLRCETGHPCPENIVTFVPMRAAIDAARKEGGAT
jgi:hypothetical protein